MMTTIRTFLVAGLFLSLMACSPNDRDGGVSNPKKELVELQIVPGQSKSVSFTLKATEVVIEWGDGKTDTYTGTAGEEEYIVSHTYANAASRTIKLSPSSLVGFSMSAFWDMGELVGLTFTDCDKLTSVTAAAPFFDLSKLPAVKKVDISEGDYTVGQIDAILAKLPKWTGAEANAPVIYVNGDQQYTESIATGRGWKIGEWMHGNPITPLPDNLNEPAFREVLAGRYAEASEWFRDFYMFEGLYSNTIKLSDITSPSQYEKDVYNHDHGSTDFREKALNLYREAEGVISGCNIINEYSDRKDELKKYGYTARALRAFMYYNMINLWGDLVYKETASFEQSLLISSAAEIADKLITDLKYLETVSPTQQPDGFPLLFTPDAVRALLAKVYLWKGDKTNALLYAKQIIATQKFGLYPFADIAKIYAFGSAVNTEKITPFGVEFNNIPVPYQPLIKVTGVSNYSIPSVRYAEILLIAAESSTVNSEKVGYLNQVRARNGRTLLETDAAGSEITNAIVEEYKLDLGNEGMYLFTLKRLDLLTEVLGFTHLGDFLTRPYPY